MKYLKLIILGFALCAVQAFFSMYEFRNEPSSACLGCSFKAEILGYSFFIWLGMMVVFFMVSFFTKKLLMTLYLLIYIITCLSVNYSIFNSRVSSWGTFTLTEEMLSVLNYSLIPLLISIILLVLFFFNVIEFLKRKR